ncbi:hypothetical protein PAHAL_3G332600 [Panicum hallii]|uniref:Uncharacterized protein n=1 Tax=Panicum hallii TaxID=206008 RepID=A0A2T8KKC7_9POAL|nr:hypothetical protein PAHAL_3G332600 [Panicum hallii]
MRRAAPARALPQRRPPPARAEPPEHTRCARCFPPPPRAPARRPAPSRHAPALARPSRTPALARARTAARLLPRVRCPWSRPDALYQWREEKGRGKEESDRAAIGGEKRNRRETPG